MSNFELWVKSFENSDKVIWILEDYEDDYNRISLYKTMEAKTVKNSYKSSPMFHVWVNDKWDMAGLNYNEAYNVWKNRVDELKRA